MMNDYQKGFSQGFLKALDIMDCPSKPTTDEVREMLEEAQKGVK